MVVLVLVSEDCPEMLTYHRVRAIRPVSVNVTVNAAAKMIVTNCDGVVNETDPVAGLAAEPVNVVAAT